MKKLFFCICAMMLSAHCLGQTAKNVLYDCTVDNIDYQEPVQKKTAEKIVKAVGAGLTVAAGGQSTTNTDEPQYAQGVREAIIAGVAAARRVEVTYGTPSGERPVLCLSGNISTIQSVTTMYNQEGLIDKKEHLETGYRASIIGTVTITDATSGTILATLNLAHKGVQFGWESSVDKAFKQELASLQKSITNQMNQFFPLYANIVEGNSAKKDKQKEVYIDLGEPSGVVKGMQFFVYQVTNVAGKEAKKEIGRIKVTEVMGDDISLCKVTKGGKEIKEAVDAGTELQIMSKE